ncbi:MAG: peptidylprolyl isomerase [Ignavibacteriae bacterium]|jgi:peptidyl-prolyl cis-trans isomerase D|nr:peptidylprolyl isomerase [Ignavibacteriota bacterium]
MGIISRMRDISPYMLVIFVVSFIAFMVASDSNIGTILNSSSTGSVVGTINGEEVSYQEFELRVKEQADMQRQQNPQAEVDENIIRQAVWDQFVEEALIRQAGQAAGIKVTQDEVLDIMLDSPPEYLTRNFTDSTGTFNRQAYLDVMTNPDMIAQNIAAGKKAGMIPESVDPAEEVAKFKNSLLKIEDFMYKSRLLEHFRRASGTAASIVSPTYLKNKYVNESSTFDFDYIHFNVNNVDAKSIGKPTDQELQAEYEIVKEFTKQKPARKIKYVSFPLEPSKQDTLVASKKIARIQQSLVEAITPEAKVAAFDQYFAEYSGSQLDYQPVKKLAPDVAAILGAGKQGDVIGPITLQSGTFIYKVDSLRSGVNELVKASHILIKFGSNKDSAKAFASQVLARAKKGEDFAALALEYSQDPGSKDRGGEYDYFPKGQMVKPFEDACFNNAPGSVVGPVETDFGYHIIKVSDKISEEIKYSEIMVTIGMTMNTKKQLRRDALSFKQQLDDGQNIESLAKKLKKNVVETMFFDTQMPVLGSQSLTSFAFSNEVGAISEPMELKYYGIVVAQITGKREAGLRPFEDMKDELAQKVIFKKKMNILKSKANSVYQKIKSSDRLFAVTQIDPTIEVKTAAKVRNNGLVNGVGNEPVLTQKALLAPLNKINEPVAGDNGWYIYQVIQKTNADMSGFAKSKKDMQMTLSTQSASSAYSQWFNALKDKADIQDYRGKLFRD